MNETAERENKMLNPRIRDVDIGIRNLRKVTIYPLSIPDQEQLIDVITSAVREFFLSDAPKDDYAFTSFVVKQIKDNMKRIMELITDEKDIEALLRDIDNYQLTEIANIIWEVNFDLPGKNAKSLFEKLKNLFPSEGLSPMSLSDIQDTVLKTSKESPSEKVESPSDN